MTKSNRTTATLLAALCLILLLAAGPAQAAEIDVALDRIERILGDVERIQDVIQGNPPNVEYERKRLHTRQGELEKERVRAMSAAAGVPRGQVQSMRSHGMSWAQIAHDLHVSPRVVGVATGKYGERDFRRGHERDDDDRDDGHPGKGHGKPKGMPPGQAKKMGHGNEPAALR